VLTHQIGEGKTLKSLGNRIGQLAPQSPCHTVLDPVAAARVFHTADGSDKSLHGEYDIVDSHFSRILDQHVPPLGSPDPLDDPGPPQSGENALQILDGDALTLRDILEKNKASVRVKSQVEQGPNSIPATCGKLHFIPSINVIAQLESSI